MSRWRTACRRRLVLVVTVVVITLAATAGGFAWRVAGGSDEQAGERGTPTEPHRLTLEEAGRLAQVLVEDHQAGGATFRLTIATLAGGSLALEGTVDWANHRGEATVVSSRTPEVTAVRWGEGVVYERVAGLAEATGDERLVWVARPAAAPDATELDLAMHLLVQLANERAENAVLLSQDPANRWLRSTTLRGEDVEVFAAGPTTRYWVRAGTSELVRMEGGGPADGHTIVVDLLERGPVAVEAPDPATVIGRGDLAASLGPPTPSTTVASG